MELHLFNPDSYTGYHDNVPLSCKDCGRGEMSHPKENRIMTDAMFCDHANEVPARCHCDPECYCIEHTCKWRKKDMVEVKNISDEEVLKDGYDAWFDKNYSDFLDYTEGERVWIAARRALMRDMSPFRFGGNAMADRMRVECDLREEVREHYRKCTDVKCSCRQ